MTEDRKKECRVRVEKENWHKVGIIEPQPSVSYWNKEVEIMYEDMDGYPKTCKAIYVKPFASTEYFKGTSGATNGNRMAKVIAWREINNNDENMEKDKEMSAKDMFEELFGALLTDKPDEKTVVEDDVYKQGAIAIRKVYDAFKDVGFTDEQAMKLVIMSMDMKELEE
jgi:hypothetical protein